MMTILIFAGIVAILLIYNIHTSLYNDFLEYLSAFIIGGACGGVMGFVIASALPMDTYNKHYSLNISSLNDNNTTSGTFFLGSGRIDGEMKYVFYYEEDGFYKMGQIDYNRAKIKYSNNAPKIDVTEKCPSNSLINKFAIDFDIHKKTYIISIPKGSIKNNYILDAQ